MRLINADELLSDMPYGVATIRQILVMPTIDAVPVKHGKWIDGKCDQCGKHAPFWSMATTYYKSNFCPHCGAKMDNASPD